MAELKTFLFTDIVGSVELKGEMPGRSDAERDQAFIEQILMPHRQRIERELAASGGRVVSTAGDGNFLVFSDTVLAARWSIGVQQSHRDESIRTPRGGTVGVRMSLHLGIPQVDPQDPNNFVGKPVDYAARLCDYATGGQILVSRSVVAVLEDAGMDGVSFHRHGSRELRGIGKVDIYELVYDAAGPRKMRPQPRESLSREWTVLPATVGLTDFLGGSGGGTGAAGDTRKSIGTSVAPTRLGNYVLEERLGSGGMGDVYRARHSQFGRVRAVKVIKQHFVEAGHDEVIRRFYQEIKAVGALEHPNIVVAIDSSAPSDAVHFLVMEYIDGIGADELVARHGPLPMAEACEIARQAARGLAYIHQHGMVHRDIKPSNLMLALVRTDEEVGWHAQSLGDGRGVVGDAPRPSQAQGVPPEYQQAVVKILDLGLALLVGDDQQRLTLFDNRAMGTAMYMSPEQWKTTSVDIRADIYSLGCTLYHLLVGHPPFWKSDLRPEKAHEREPLPPPRAGISLPAPVWELLEKMTAKKPDERFADPAELAATLARFAEGHQLARLVRQECGPSPRTATQGFAKGETIVAGSEESDTLLGRSPAGWSLSKSLPQSSRRRLSRVLVSVGMLTAVAAIIWLSIQATGGRESLAVSRQRLLQVASNSAANEIRNEIGQRFDILQRDASTKWLQQTLIAIDDAPADEAMWEPLGDWLGARKVDGDQDAPSESWFISDRRGTQVARSPPSDSVGHNYAFRDYFNGEGRNYPPETEGLAPIEAPHISTVYESTSDETLRVAFSVPIENGLSTPSARKVVGVLAMSVDLGEFNVLENVLRKEEGQEVVLIDLGEDYLSGEAQRGLILHHGRGEQFGKDEPPQRISAEMLARIEEVLSTEASQTKGGAAAQRQPSHFLGEYSDPLSEESQQKYWGAVERVILMQPGGERRDTGWLVLVQEPVERRIAKER